MILKKWKQEPEDYEVLAIFKGETSDFLVFINVWQEWEGTLDIKAAAIDQAHLWWDSENVPSPLAYAIRIDKRKLPSYYFIHWFQEKENWKLFYYGKGNGSSNESRIFCPWGYELAEKPGTYKRGIIQENNDYLGLPPEEDFKNVFERHINDINLVLAGDNSPMKRITTQFNPLAKASHSTLNVRLIEKLSANEAENLKMEISRLEKKIKDLTEILEFKKFWSEEKVKIIRLHVYFETEESVPSGHFQSLRNWIIKASNEELEQFRHIRHETSIGVLHLVFPKDLDREPDAHLPRPQYQLVLNKWWEKKGRKIFIPEGMELYPLPPESNEKVNNMLIESLFADMNEKDILILLRHQRKDYYFSISPLDQVCFQQNNYHALLNAFPFAKEVFDSAEIVKNRNNRYYIDIKKFKSITGKEKMILFKKIELLINDFEKYFGGFEYKKNLEKYWVKKISYKYMDLETIKERALKQAVVDHLHQQLFKDFTSHADFPLLADQLEMINMQILLKHANSDDYRNKRKEEIETILDLVHQDIMTPIENSADKVKELFQLAWDQSKIMKNGAKEVKDEMAEMEKVLKQYKEWQKIWKPKLEISKNWLEWSKFPKEVLETDREITPFSNHKSLLEKLDEARHKLSCIYVHEDKRTRSNELRQVISSLKELDQDLEDLLRSGRI